MKLLIQYGPAAAGLIIALVFLLLNRTKQVSLPRPVRLMTTLSLGLVTIYYVASYASGVWPGWKLPVPIPSGPDRSLYFGAFTYALPLALTIVVLIFLIFPIPAAGPSGTATLAPRTPTTFASRGWLCALAGLAIGALALAVLAGLESSPDTSGRHVLYELQISSTHSSSPSIYGWWFSVPNLIAIALVIALALIGLALISRPTLISNASLDIEIRTRRVHNILVVACGGILLHLSAILESLAGTASVIGSGPTGDGGTFEVGASFAAAGPALLMAGYVCMVLGLAFWWLVILSAATAKTSAKSKVVTP